MALPRDTPSWAARYIGAPYVHGARAGDRGFNCWGLFAAVQREQNDFNVAEYEGPLWKGKNAHEIGQAAEAFAARFIEVQRGEERVFDAVLLRMRGHPIHVGVVTSPGWMLHIEEGADACVESYLTRDWEKRIVALYRPEYRTP